MNHHDPSQSSGKINNTGENVIPSEISVEATNELMRSENDFLLIDCRDESEHKIASIKGSILIPMYELPERLNELEDYRKKRIVVHCHHGGRSLQVVNWLRNHGFEHAQNMTGGIDAWARSIDPSVARY